MINLWRTLVINRIYFAKKTTNLIVAIKVPASTDFLTYALG
jgi:hypothetical protein